MVVSSQQGSDANVSTSGIVFGHAYTVLNAVELNFNGNIYRLVQLRNPWGKTESKTSWCDTDPRWNQVSPQVKKQIGYTNDTNDGTFFQEYDDFIQNFRMLTVAEVDDNASYIYSTQQSSARKGCYFKVRILQEGVYSLQINQNP
jgi:hypothetical protein